MAGIDNNTVLYLRGEDITDSSLTPKPITNNGVTINNNGEFGKSLHFDNNYGSGNYLELPSFDNSFLSGDFTIEWWEYCLGSVGGTTVSLFNTKTVKSSNMCGFTLGHEGVRLYTLNSSGTTQINSVFKDRTNNEWVHWRLVKQGGVWTSYKNGTKFWTTTIEYTPKIDIGAMMGCLYYSSGLGRGYNAYIDEFLITKNVLCTENFTPPTQPYNSITINKTNQTDTNIEFNIEKLGQETINKVEVLVNGTVSETYTDSYDNINYLIDTELCVLGNNDITIRVTYDDLYTEELSLTHKVTVDELPLETPLIDTVERVKLLTKSKQNEKTILSSILTSKNVEVSEEDKMSDLIGKVDLLGEYDDGKLWLYKEGSDTESVESYWGNRLQYGTSWWYGPQTKGTIYSDKFVCEVSQKRSIQTITTTSKVDLSKYNKLYFECKVDEYTPDVGSSVGILVTNNIIEEPSSWILSKYYINTTTSRNKYFIDISNINTSAYISTLALNNDSASKTKISFYNIWLDK